MLICVYKTLWLSCKDETGRKMQTTKQVQEGDRLKAILKEASMLSVNEQEQVLAVIRGMLFTRSCFLEKEEKK